MGILTGDLISELPFKTLTQSMIFPYAEPKELKNLDMILKNNYADENVTKLRELMMSNINWDYLIEEYLKFKTENNDLTSLSNFISGSINTFGGKRKKRQIENTISPIILNMTDMESLINTLLVDIDVLYQFSAFCTKKIYGFKREEFLILIIRVGVCSIILNIGKKQFGSEALSLPPLAPSRIYQWAGKTILKKDRMLSMLKRKEERQPGWQR